MYYYYLQPLKNFDKLLLRHPYAYQSENLTFFNGLKGKNCKILALNAWSYEFKDPLSLGLPFCCF